MAVGIGSRKAAGSLSLPLRTSRVSRGTPTKVSGVAPKQSPLKLAGYPQLLAAPSGGHAANVSGGTLITHALAAEGIPKSP